MRNGKIGNYTYFATSMLNRLITTIILLIIFTTYANLSFGQTPVTDSLWKEIHQLPADTSRVNAVIKSALWLQSHLKNSEEEEKMLQAGLKLATDIGYEHGRAVCFNLLGVYYRNISEYVKSVSLHEKALEISRGMHDSVTMAYALNSMGVAYRRLDENQKAFKYHFEALGIAKAIGNRRGRAIAMNSIANIYLSLGHYKNAIEEFEQCLELEKQSQNNIGIAINYANLGAAYEGLGKLDKAISYYRQSLKYNSLEGSDKGLAICYNLLGEAYLKKGMYTLALQYLRQALSYNDKLRDQINVAENYITIGKILQKKNNGKKALEAKHRGLSIATNIGSRSLMIEAYQAIATSEKILGHHSKAYEAMKQAYLFRDSLYIEQAAPEMAKMRALYGLDKKNDQIKLLRQDNEISKLRLNRRMFIVIAAIIMLLLSLIGVYFYLRYKRQKSHRVNLQYELQSLRSQMSPHFIFNSLNSIHKYIWANDQKNASEYLTKFSRLIRMILENSRSKSILLKDEIEFLNLYLELEHFRCNGKFTYAFHISPQINTDEILFPTMIIQPFIENAVWHGLAPKEVGSGLLEIRFFIQDELIVCEVEDNGIGRKKAMEIKTTKATTHKSLGIQVTEDRIELLQKATGNKGVQIETIDLENNKQEASGTLIKIKLPLDYAY